MNRKWFKGDLHTHTTHSDGEITMKGRIAAAEKLGYDFLAVTDHDDKMYKKSHQPTHWFDENFVSNKVVLIPAIEWTTDKGHANMFFCHKPQAPSEYQPFWQANVDKSAEELFTAAFQHRDILVSINHSSNYFLPWSYNVWPAQLEAMEVWNSSLFNCMDRNVKTVEKWDSLLKEGRHITGLGGSDMHFKKGPIAARVNRDGMPTTWILAQENSDSQALVEAMRQGRVSISMSPTAPRVDLSMILSSGERRFMGDVVRGQPQQVRIRITLVGSGPEIQKPWYDQEVEYMTQPHLHPPGPLSSESLNALKEHIGDPLPLNNWLENTGLRIVGRHGFLVVLIGDGEIVTAYRLGKLDPEGRSTIEHKVQLTPSMKYFRVAVFGLPSFFVEENIACGNLICLSNPVYVDI